MTLEPGVYDREQAPWWRFECFETDAYLSEAAKPPHPHVVVAQWMGEAARNFAQVLTDRAAGGEARVRVMFTTLDGMTGQFEVTMTEQKGTTVYITVERNEMVQNG